MLYVLTASDMNALITDFMLAIPRIYKFVFRPKLKSHQSSAPLLFVSFEKGNSKKFMAFSSY